MKTVWHYPLDPEIDWQEIDLPRGAKLLRYEGGSPGHSRFWAEVDPDAPLEPRVVGVFGTGWSIPDNARHIYTDVGPTGYVWHLYEPEEDE